jgi:deoxyuridine 5''-triphosphate nucleotidohydrolase (dut)
MQVRFKRLSDKAILPSYAKPGDAGLDISAVYHKIDADHNYIEYFTGLAVEIPEGHVGLLFPRSSVSKTDLALANCVGVVDSGYRGELTFRYKFAKEAYFASLKRYQDGDRIGQLVIMPYPTIEPIESEELSDTERGSGGYGSTGK